jgi:phosphoribosylformimino-5-aminoimidazole carboxamide ribotide isomerase
MVMPLEPGLEQMPPTEERSISVVPVIDLKHGLAVRAIGGQRDAYAPIKTPLSATADPVDVARGLLGSIAAETLYVADLDAIEGRGPDRSSVRRLRAALTGTELWVDAGFAQEAQVKQFLEEGIGKPVLGSESQTSADLVQAFKDEAVLSLDFRGDTFIGPPALLDDPSIWPPNVIVMTLARVGTSAGPDVEKLTRIKSRAPHARVYAAGGLRGPEDLPALVQIGVSGVLVATALHDGRLRREHLLR